MFYHRYLHVSVYSRELVHLSLLAPPSLLNGVIVVVKLVVRDGAEVRTGGVWPVLGPGEAGGVTGAGDKHAGVRPVA